MIDRSVGAAGLGLILALAPDSASAQSFDCARARSPVERAICASPTLREQDAALAKVYATLLTQAASRAADFTREQRQWLAERARDCAPTPPSPKFTPLS